MNLLSNQFLQEERGAITVDWVVLSAAAVAMSIAATDVIRGGLAELSSDLEAQLRTQQISDAFVQFASNHFDVLYDAGMLTEEQAEQLFADANEMTNADILSSLETYIEKMTNGTITESELQQAFAVASVAYQRNIVDDAVIEYYFTPNGEGYVSTDSPSV
ncbi:MAG: hypothetical protein AAGF88_12790 [Pseudomonadota bacterium]